MCANKNKKYPVRKTQTTQFMFTYHVCNKNIESNTASFVSGMQCWHFPTYHLFVWSFYGCISRHRLKYSVSITDFVNVYIYTTPSSSKK